MNPSPLKTFSHLQAAKRVPSDYEVGSTELLYYRTRGFEVETPIVEWYKKYQQGSPLKCSDWDRFADPRQTTYASYTLLQSTKEAFTTKLFESIERNPDATESAPWRQEVIRTVGCLRFLFHGLQMGGAYLGQMAPASKITIACAFQTADEMRKVHVFSYCLALLDGSEAQSSAMSAWMTDPAWQTLRQLVETLLTVYDWGEALATLCFAVKPQIDHLLKDFMNQSKINGHYRISEVVGSLLEDSEWHTLWANALRQMLIQDNPANEQLLQMWTLEWEDKAKAAIDPLRARWRGK